MAIVASLGLGHVIFEGVVLNVTLSTVILWGGFMKWASVFFKKVAEDIEATTGQNKQSLSVKSPNPITTCIDAPCIGMRTVDSLIQTKVRTLVVEAERTLFIEKERVLEALDRAKICVIGKTI